MAVTKTPRRYRTSDGSEFESKEIAEAYENRERLRFEYQTAKRQYEHALAEVCLTADGHQFRFDCWTYWMIVCGWSMPQLTQVKPSRWMDIEVDQQDEKTDVILHQERRDHGGELRFESYRLSELYANEVEAKKDLLKKRREWLAAQKRTVDGTK